MKSLLTFLLATILIGTCSKISPKKEFKVLDINLPELDTTLDCGASIRYGNYLHDGNFMLSFNVKLVYYRSLMDMSTDTFPETVEKTLNSKFVKQGIYFDVTNYEVIRLTELSIEDFEDHAKEYEEDGYITIILYDDVDFRFAGIAEGIPSTVIGVQKDVLEKKETLTHEMGHALGLKHIFEPDPTNGRSLHYGDHICDTPSFNIMDFRTHGCGHTIKSIYSEEDLKVIIPNYLNYSFEQHDCREYFTPQQSLAMRWHIANFPKLERALQ